MKYLTFDFDLGVKVTKFGFFISFLWLLYGAIFNEIRSGFITKAVQDLLQNKKLTFDFDL